MDFKELFRKKDGVSPVIGTTLMLAITVILAAIAMSSVTDMKSTPSLSEVTIGITANDTATATTPASVKLDHLSGESITFGDPKVTKVTASLNGADSVPIDATSLETLSVGDIKILLLTSDGTTNAFGTGPVSGDIVAIKIIDLKANQIICNQEVEF